MNRRKRIGARTPTRRFHNDEGGIGKALTRLSLEYIVARQKRHARAVFPGQRAV